ncbi:3-isopropylmalate dehydratase large subunit [Noviherbaspirillum suwonense]|uniref:3-isopropylmalate/(R)-2-methylmalate dehydratase large subunit n=1 Tax=Noviherbaspirillum suwonense TaxID=1224511 RepID=A0ABY1QQG5_9BURK|nr:3-isopropylmalate dehydratase large subunit [Noviherbaspirillum suwonense]SMP77304.1 3-isopropylmalate/(R)-2-methylmalate dehydratase large subunit [Noviherbaspirillum suwonense]
MKTLAQKIIARAAGKDAVEPGEIVTCKVDLAMSHDSSGPRRVAPMLEALGARVWDPDRYVIVTDHYVPAADPDSQQILRFTRDWVQAAGIRNFHDEQGICHVVLPEQGHLRPGMLAVGGDSHSSTGGAFGAYMFGIGATEMLGVLVTGEIWLKVPGTILLEWTGCLCDGVSAKDMMLFLCAKLGMDGGQYQTVEYAGDAVAALDMQERMTLANMAAELGAQAGLVAPDAITRAYLQAVGALNGDGGDFAQERALADWRTDAGAPLLAHHVFDAAALSPHVAAPHSPANAAPVDRFEGQEIDTAYIGACTGAKLSDLRMAARILRGRRVATGKRLLVAPASLRDQQVAQSEGALQALADAGAQILPIGCGACAGYGQFRFGEGERVISSTARNFRGRMGAASSRVWLASPYTVAASAVAGRIVDPRILLEAHR